LTFVDTNVLLDLVLGDRVWLERSRAALARRQALGRIFIVDAVFAETSVPFDAANECEQFLDKLDIERRTMSPEALWRAGQAFRAYRRRGGIKTYVLADFFVGAQADVDRLALLTRDFKRYRTYFPQVQIISP
jgi:predicted nucleic acid-binding protein